MMIQTTEMTKAKKIQACTSRCSVACCSQRKVLSALTHHHHVAFWWAVTWCREVTQQAEQRAQVNTNLPPCYLQACLVVRTKGRGTTPHAISRTLPASVEVKPKATWMNNTVPKKGHTTAPQKVHVSSSSSGMVMRRSYKEASHDVGT